MAPMKLALAALALAAACAGGDLGDTLTKETAADAAASRDAERWCSELTEAMGSRGREAQLQLQNLESQRTVRHLDNEQLRLEVAGHEAQVSEHQQSLDTGAAIVNRTNTAYQEEEAFHQAALKSVQEAKAEIPEGSGDAARDALQGLEQNFTKKLEAAQAGRQSRIGGVLDAKAKLLRLAREAAATKKDSLANGTAAVELAGAQIGLYTAQAEADAALSTAAGDLCAELRRGAAERERKRQQAQVALSQANLEAAQAAAAASRAQLALVGHGSAGALDDAKRAAADLAALVARSGTVQAGLVSVLSSTVMDAHLAAGGGAHATVKAAVAALGAEADADLKRLPPLFEAARSAGGLCGAADQKLIAGLTAGQA